MFQIERGVCFMYAAAITVILLMVVILGVMAYYRDALDKKQERSFNRLIDARAERAEKHRQEIIKYYSDREKSEDTALAERFRDQVKCLNAAITRELAKDKPDKEAVKILTEAQSMSVACIRKEGYILGMGYKGGDCRPWS
jgi:CHAD domain-containing protein